MATVAELAADMGIDISTAPADKVAKWNSIFSDGDTKLQNATAAQLKAKEELEQAQAERADIDAKILEFGMTDARVRELEASNAAMQAAMGKLRESGLNIDIPQVAPAKQPKQVSAEDVRRDVDNAMVVGFRLTNKYQRIFGSPIPDDLDVLAREASAARMPMEQYVEKKYDFAGQIQKKADADKKAHDDMVAKAAIEKYKEENPPAADNSFMRGGGASRNSQVFKQKTGQEFREFANLPAREKIAASVAKSKTAIAATQQ